MIPQESLIDVPELQIAEFWRSVANEFLAAGGPCFVKPELAQKITYIAAGGDLPLEEIRNLLTDIRMFYDNPCAGVDKYTMSLVILPAKKNSYEISKEIECSDTEAAYDVYEMTVRMSGLNSEKYSSNFGILAEWHAQKACLLFLTACMNVVEDVRRVVPPRFKVLKRNPEELVLYKEKVKRDDEMRICINKCREAVETVCSGMRANNKAKNIPLGLLQNVPAGTYPVSLQPYPTRAKRTYVVTVKSDRAWVKRLTLKCKP